MMIPTRKISKEIIILLLIIAIGFFLRLYFWSDLKTLSWDEAAHVLGGVMINQTIANDFSMDYVSQFTKHYWAVMGSLFFYPYGYTISSAVSFFIFGFNEFAARAPGMIFGLLIIHAIYLLATRIFNKKVGLFSAFIAAINPWFILWGGQALVDLPMTCLMVYSIYFCFKAIEDNRIQSWFLAGLFASLAGLMKPPGFVVVPFLILIIVYYKGFKFLLKKPFIILISTVLLSLISYFGFGILALFILPKLGIISQTYGEIIYGDIFHWFNYALSHFEEGDPSWRTLAGWLYYPKLLLRQMGDFIILILAALGILALILNKNYRKLLSLLLIYIIFIYLVFTILDNKDSRYTIPYLPFFCILAGLGFEKIAITYKKLIAWFLTSVVLILVIVSSFNIMIEVIPRNNSSSYLDEIAKLITNSRPGLALSVIEDNNINVHTLSFYMAINDPKLNYQASWPVMREKAHYIISREEIDMENSMIIYDKNKIYVYQIYR